MLISAHVCIYEVNQSRVSMAEKANDEPTSARPGNRSVYAKRGPILSAEKKTVPPEDRKTARECLDSRRFFRDQTIGYLNTAIKEGFSGVPDAGFRCPWDEKNDTSLLKITKTIEQDAGEIKTAKCEKRDGNVSYHALYKFINTAKSAHTINKKDVLDTATLLFKSIAGRSGHGGDIIEKMDAFQQKDKQCTEVFSVMVEEKKREAELRDIRFTGVETFATEMTQGGQTQTWTISFDGKGLMVLNQFTNPTEAVLLVFNQMSFIETKLIPHPTQLYLNTLGQMFKTNGGGENWVETGEYKTYIQKSLKGEYGPHLDKGNNANVYSNNGMHVTLNFLRATVPEIRRVDIERSANGFFATKQALDNVYTTTFGISKLHFARFTLAAVAKTLNLLVGESIKEMRRDEKFTNLWKVAHDNEKYDEWINEQAKMSLNKDDVTEEAIIQTCEFHANTICSGEGVSALQEFCVGVAILTDCVGMLYHQLYTHAEKRALLMDLVKNKQAKAMDGGKTDEKSEEPLQQQPSQSAALPPKKKKQVHGDSKPENETTAIKLELKSQMGCLFAGTTHHMHSEDTVVSKPFYAGFGVLVRIWHSGDKTIQPNKRANWPRAAKIDGIGNINGNTTITSVCKVSADIPSRSACGYQWGMRMRYEIRTQTYLSLRVLFGTGSEHENVFKWLKQYNSLNTDPGKTRSTKDTAKAYISIKPNITGKISLKLLFPIKNCDDATIDRSTNSLPSINEKSR